MLRSDNVAVLHYVYIEWSRFGDDDVVSYLVPQDVDSLDSGHLDIVVISSGQVVIFLLVLAVDAATSSVHSSLRSTISLVIFLFL